jgi:ADP-ribose pyrophosphatase
MRKLLRADELADRPERWTVEARTVLGRGAISDFRDDAVRTPSGQVMRRQYTSHPGAVGVVAWNDDDQLAVVRQYRHPVGFVMVEPPAGLLDHAGEDPLEAARRELAEEAGLAAGRWRVLVDAMTTPGATQETLRMFLATDLSPAPAPVGFTPEGEEAEMDVCWAARADLVDAIYAGRLQSPTMVAGLLALEAARLGGRLESLRRPDAPWPARENWRDGR